MGTVGTNERKISSPSVDAYVSHTLCNGLSVSAVARFVPARHTEVKKA